jgi:hypothetical protein
VRFRERLLLFTEYEIWAAVPSGDDYAFRFARVREAVGTRWTKTITTTPEGVVFLGSDYEVYITDGTSAVPLGPIGAQGASRVQRKLRDEALGLDRAWATYNQDENRYELYYAVSGAAGGYPNRGMFYSFKHQTWWPQVYPFALSAGESFVNVVPGTSWDDVTETWDSVTSFWDSFNAATGDRAFNVFESNGSVLRSLSTQTTDDGTAIDVRWRSPGFKAGTRKVHLKEIWIDYENDSNSSASLWLGSSLSGSVYESQVAVSMTTTGDPLFAPVWETDHHPAFEIRINDGGKPRIASFSATIQDASKF